MCIRDRFRDIVIKPLTSFPDISRRFVSKPGPAPEPVRTQLNIKLEKAGAAAVQ